MLKTGRRRLRAAALASLAVVAPATALPAQETNTIGPPQLRDFRIPGERTTPPAPQPAPATTAAPSPAATRPPATAAPATAAPTPRSVRRDAARAAPALRPATPAPSSAPQIPLSQLPARLPVQTAPVVVPPPAAPAPAPRTTPAPPAPAEAAATDLRWLWLGLPVLLAIGALLFFRRRRSAGQWDEADRASLAGSLFEGEAAPGPEPVAEAAAPAEQPAAAEARAWLELDMVPERAAATDKETVVNYELVLSNRGQADARNIRIDTRMFNAGAEQEIGEFFAGPIHEVSGSPHVAIRPGGELRLGSAIGMAKEDVRSIEVQGRTIFVPMIAINVAYDWEGGSGRSSKSWLVGREAATPSAKMGPFRLDLGPRIYRQVGRREGKLVMV